MVGDRMDTDVISGLESGMSTVLVLPGVPPVKRWRRMPISPTSFWTAWATSPVWPVKIRNRRYGPGRE